MVVESCTSVIATQYIDEIQDIASVVIHYNNHIVLQGNLKEIVGDFTWLWVYYANCICNIMTSLCMVALLHLYVYHSGTFIM